MVFRLPQPRFKRTALPAFVVIERGDGEAAALWHVPDGQTLTESVQRREERWAIVDLVGKGRHIRTVRSELGEETLDTWLTAAGIESGPLFSKPWGHGISEKTITPPVVADHRNQPVNALGYLRVMFAVDDIDETLGRLRKRGAQVVGEAVRYQDSYRLCYIRGPEGLLIGLAQELN
jgi:catechol 2,3-dioxygenase-like lactoylglutathione lyase family enzyme